MRTMRVAGMLALIASAVTPCAARAQDAAQSRVEIGSAIFGGGMLWLPAATVGDPASRSYVLNAALTVNVTRWIGLEGEGAFALGSSEAVSLYGTLPSEHPTPNMFLGNGLVVYNPLGRNRRAVPYVSGGLGSLSVFGGPETAGFALQSNTSYLTGIAGAGLRWFPKPHWGLRADYQFLAIRNDASPAPDGQRTVRSAHKVYFALTRAF